VSACAARRPARHVGVRCRASTGDLVAIGLDRSEDHGHRRGLRARVSQPGRERGGVHADQLWPEPLGHGDGAVGQTHDPCAGTDSQGAISCT
jgi:hypothetical protein